MWKTTASITPRKLDANNKKKSQNKEPTLSFDRERVGSLYVAMLAQAQDFAYTDCSENDLCGESYCALMDRRLFWR